MIPIDEHLFADQEALTTELCALIKKLLNKAIAEHGHAVLIVSGGSTPRPLFQQLSKTNIDWKKVIITLADERCVPSGHNDSNERLVREMLLIENAETAEFRGLFRSNGTSSDCLKEIEADLDFLVTPADVIVLGMGDDGHTASLFPYADNISTALDPQGSHKVTAITPTDAAHDRITLTLPVLANANNLILHITGDNKKHLLDTILAGDKDLPIGRVLSHARQLPRLFWAA